MRGALLWLCDSYSVVLCNFLSRMLQTQRWDLIKCWLRSKLNQGCKINLWANLIYSKLTSVVSKGFTILRFSRFNSRILLSTEMLTHNSCKHHPGCEFKWNFKEILYGQTSTSFGCRHNNCHSKSSPVRWGPSHNYWSITVCEVFLPDLMPSIVRGLNTLGLQPPRAVW